ncbi:DUF554 domain-containing protein [Desulfocurvus sp. DL9XJH121]
MTGPFINSIGIVAGAILGSFTGGAMSQGLRERANYAFGCCSLSLGVFMVAKGQSMPPAIIAVLAGLAVGELLRLDAGVMRLAFKAVGLFQRKRPKTEAAPENVFRDQFSVVTVLFCFSVLGTVGPMQEGMTGDFSLLLVKALLDFFTAMVFAANIGSIVGALALPQLIMQSLLFFAATLILPLTTPAMLADFTTCGGIIMLGTSLRQFSLVQVPILGMLPALFLVMPISALWARFMG